MDTEDDDFLQIEAEKMFRLAERLWPLNRSLSGEGVRQTLDVIAEENPGLRRFEVPTGTAVFDWEVPKEWRVREAFIVTPSGEKICDFAENNLHLVGYSAPFMGNVSLAELQDHLHSLPTQPDAIPYVTSYYEENWGFCISHAERENLEPGEYLVHIDSELFEGSLTYGELVIKGISTQEIMFSTYICHPSMANNELSGPVLSSRLADFIRSRDRFFTYRFVFVPETIGSLMYLKSNLSHLKENLLAGFILTCVGDDRTFSYIPSRKGNTTSDRMALSVAKELDLEMTHYSWLDRGSDERQYCAPGIDLSFCSITRSKYGEFPEYHTSLDKLGSVVNVDGLAGSLRYYTALVSSFESERFPRANQSGEPQLGKRGLYPNVSRKDAYSIDNLTLLNVLSFCDGTLSIAEIANFLGLPRAVIEETLDTLAKHNLVTI